MQKLYYSISEVSEMIGEPSYVLRYWEKEFPPLQPKKNRAGNRIYSEKDLEILRAIKTMLREQKLSMNGAVEEINRLYGKMANRKGKRKKTTELATPSPVEISHKKKLTEPRLFDPMEYSKINLLEIRDTLKSISDLLKSL